MAKGKGNTVMEWSIMLAGLALLLLIMLILFGNLSGNVGFVQDTKTITVTNETGGYVNISGYTLAISNSSTSSHTITSVIANGTGLTGAFTIPAANYTISSVGVLTNATIVTDAIAYDDANVSYTLVYSTDSKGLADTNNFITNYTTSVLNTSKQFPVVGTIIGVALLLLILIGILVFALRKMSGISAGGSGGNFG